jgi:hypothetical protein
MNSGTEKSLLLYYQLKGKISSTILEERQNYHSVFPRAKVIQNHCHMKKKSKHAAKNVEEQMLQKCVQN